MTLSNENWLDGVVRTPLIPQISANGWDNASFQLSSMHRDLYDAICKIRSGEMVLVVPTASSGFTPTNDGHLMTKKAVTAAIAAISGAYILKSVLTGKGDLITCAVASTPIVIGVGADNSVLTADAAIAPGLKWSKVKEASIELADVTTGNADNAKHGFLPKLSGGADTFLSYLGTWLVPAGACTAKMTFTPYDFSTADSYAVDSNWATKDLSGTVGTDAVVLILQIEAADTQPHFRRTGDTNNDWTPANIPMQWIQPCAGGKYDYKGAGSGTVSVRLLGSWNKPT